MRKIKLGDVLDVKRGASLSGEFYAEEGEKIRLTLGNFNYPSGGFKENGSKTNIYFTGNVKEEFILKKGDIITPLTEQVSGLLGETARIPEDDLYIQSGDIGLVIPNERLLDRLYAYYLLSSSMVKKQLDSAAQQTKIRHTSPEKIKECEAWLPDMNYQKQAGALLNAIDSKIEINNKINTELELMAKNIYDYWFLQYEFPNEEGKPYKSSGGKMVWNDELGREIPEGWKIRKLETVLKKFPKTKNHLTSEYKKSGKYPIIDQSKKYICGYTDDEEGVIACRDAIVFGDHTKEIKYVNFPFARGADGTQILVSADKALSNYLLFLQIQQMDLLNQGYSRYFKFLKDKNVFIPSKILNDKFMSSIFDVTFKIREGLIENQELISLRDFLLPLLMNGQVSFKEKYII